MKNRIERSAVRNNKIYVRKSYPGINFPISKPQEVKPVYVEHKPVQVQNTPVQTENKINTNKSDFVQNVSEKQEATNITNKNKKKK